MGFVRYNQSGYIGCSMSERAYRAYESGEMPLSRWTKSELVSEIAAFGAWTVEELEKIKLADLKETFLYLSSWHHTGKYATETDFWAIDEEKASDHNTEIFHVEGKKRSAIEEPDMKCKIVYEEWVGSRRRGRFVEEEAYGILRGNWVWTLYGKKKADGNHVLRIEKYNRAPKGTADTFKRIAKRM